jgi:hypothetical protein
VAQELTHRHAALRQICTVAADGLVEAQFPFFDTPEEEHGGDCLGEIANHVGSIGCGPDPELLILEPEAALPDDVTVEDEDRRQAGNAGLDAEGLQIGLERRGKDGRTLPRHRARDGPQRQYDDRRSQSSEHELPGAFSLTEP